MMHVEFADVAVLPATSIKLAAGPVAEQLVARGVTSLRDAAEWLRAAPYGPNASHDALAVFRDGFGTCTTKHAAIVTLAAELGEALQLVWGTYALDDSIIAGAGAILDQAGLPFVPNIHCFVERDNCYVDLTEGNCTGKRRQIEEYLAIARADVGDSEDLAWMATAAGLCDSDRRFAAVGVDRMREVRDACVAANPVMCTTEP